MRPKGTSLLLLLLLAQRAVSMGTHPNATGWQQILDKYLDEDGDWWQAKQRGRRAITDTDAQLILDLHNKLRGQVYPPASNMEYMQWDTELERTAEEWAETCLWEHGPASLLPQIGQNLGAHWGRYRPPTFHVQAWYDEVKDYSYPYPQECNPYCPLRCSGPVCTHYTQLVWATSSRVGCAVNMCYNMNVWGQIWAKAVYLVCNYSPKGNWLGYAPYKHGTPCSACPPSYGGGCRDNLCYKGHDNNLLPEEREENNFIEPEQKIRPRVSKPETPSLPVPAPTKPPTVVLPKNEVVNTQQMSQLVTCDTKLRDQCKGTTCNRKYQSANSFTVSRVAVKAITCETTVAQLCPYQRPAKHCPRLYCPRNCLEENPKISRVIGTSLYSDKSSICRAAVHAGVLGNNAGGYIDVMPVDKRKLYMASNQNGVVSESLQNPVGGKAFRVFAVI
ncbi:cysteine-rich secretory protein LCCL domain-containing 1-like isoform X2 [Nerophis lumbriciformis]|uniref:cysteine-rich secretory protein LCCL domain-containing 1-like isoform X2 n=1 Tax=Nerophis lumbriciformis TaxID=546530 RepID=UPI002ADF67D0|nr:cysteine-rich secretory protein LCCL domain-containing 1-like isoform X2 [Nerophis lumbriciformis]